MTESSRTLIDAGVLAALLAAAGVGAKVTAARLTAVNLRRRRILFTGHVDGVPDPDQTQRWVASTDVRAPSDWRSPAGAAYCGGIDVATEAAVLRCLRDRGVPVPAVTTVTTAAAIGGATLVSEFVGGAAIPRDVYESLAAGPQDGEARVRQVASTLAAIQSIPVAELPAGLLAPADPVAAALDAMAASADEQLQLRPVFVLALRWLRAHRPAASGRRCLVHGDFRVGRMVFDDAGVAAVIDWDGARVGDPLEDLAWFCLRTWRHGRDALAAGGLAARAPFLDAWREASGLAVDLDALGWWSVLGTFRRGLELLDQARAHIDGTVRDLDMAASGRRVTEIEFDLLRMIGSDR